MLAADGAADTVAGFVPGEDRIDLGAWTGLRNVGQLAVRSLPDGAEIRFGSEVLRIVTADGTPLSDEAVRGLGLLGVHL